MLWIFAVTVKLKLGEAWHERLRFQSCRPCRPNPDSRPCRLTETEAWSYIFSASASRAATWAFDCSFLGLTCFCLRPEKTRWSAWRDATGEWFGDLRAPIRARCWVRKPWKQNKIPVKSTSTKNLINFLTFV